jgi:hypothetical protein
MRGSRGTAYGHYSAFDTEKTVKITGKSTGKGGLVIIDLQIL